MASIGHVAVGFAASRMRERRLDWGLGLLLSALSLLPDADIVTFALGVPYGSPYGHRGASHSLIAAAAVAGLAFALKNRRASVPASARWAAWVFLVVASHGLLDTLTDGGRGVALLWPFTDRRFFSPIRPIPVAPIGSGMLSGRGLHVVLVELVLFSPLLLFAFFPKRSGSAMVGP